MPISEVYNMDCMEYMKNIPDKFFDLAIVDPQYGIDIMHKGGMPKHLGFKQYKRKDWDKSPPGENVLLVLQSILHLFRLHRNRIQVHKQLFCCFLNLNDYQKFCLPPERNILRNYSGYRRIK